MWEDSGPWLPIATDLSSPLALFGRQRETLALQERWSRWGGGVRGGFAPPSPTLHLYLLGELGGQTEAARWRGARARLGPSASGTAFCTGRRGNAAGRQRVHVDACVHQAQGHAGHRATKTRCNLADFPFVLHFSSLMFGGFCWLFFFFCLAQKSCLWQPKSSVTRETWRVTVPQLKPPKEGGQCQALLETFLILIMTRP